MFASIEETEAITTKALALSLADTSERPDISYSYNELIRFLKKL